MSKLRKITPIRQLSVDIFQEVFEKLAVGKVTHAVCCWRDKSGDVHFSATGMRDVTYLIGMVERLKMRLHDRCEDK